MKFSSAFWVLLLCLKVGSTFGQGYYDAAQRFGYQSIFGSAKSMGMGGVQMGMGADASALATNPASPALIRRSEFHFSLMPTLNQTTTRYEGGEVEASKSRMPFASFTMAFSNPVDDIHPGSFRGGTFTLSYNRMSLFDRNTTWEGTSKLVPRAGDTVKNSIIDYYYDNLNRPGFFPKDLLGNPFFTDVNLFFDTYVLDTLNGVFNTFIPRGDVLKRGAWNQTLSHGTWNAGYSANFNHTLYVGASVGYQVSDFSVDIKYGETLENVAVRPGDPNYAYAQGFKGFNFEVTKRLTQRYRALTGNVGFLYKLSDEFRLGGAIQLPTFGTVRETFESDMVANYNNISYWYNNLLPEQQRFRLGNEKSNSVPNDYNFKLRIPPRYRLGLTYVAGKTGMVGVDVEYTNMAKTRLSEGSDRYTFRIENAILADNYRPTLAVRIGGEYRFEDLRFRLGYAYQPSPLAERSNYFNNVPDQAHTFTGGIGGRYELWYWDVAVLNTIMQTRFNYNPDIMTTASTRFSSLQLRLGTGFYF